MSGPIMLLASGGCESANRECWPAQHQMETTLTDAIASQATRY